uniref:Uncharacterized protein n=1 Tax=Auxenochlorella protothecoides TaxID=3075 RepID=A0A1D2AHA8_AUXPR
MSSKSPASGAFGSVISTDRVSSETSEPPTSAQVGALVADVHSHVPEFQSRALSILAHISAQPGFQMHVWPGLTAALLEVLHDGLRAATTDPQSCPYDLYPSSGDLQRQMQALEAAQTAAAILRTAVAAGGAAAAMAAVEAGCLPLLARVLWAVHSAAPSAWPAAAARVPRTPVPAHDPGPAALCHVGSTLLRTVPALAAYVAAGQPEVLRACLRLMRPGAVSGGALLAVFAGEAVAALLLAAPPNSPMAAATRAVCWEEGDLLEVLHLLITLPYSELRSLASEYLTTQMDPGLLHELGEGREGGSVEALGPRRAAAIATAPDYLAMTHQAQAVSSAVMVLRRLVEGGEESARSRLASSPRLVEDVASVVLTTRPGYPLAWQAAVQGVAACREVLDGHMTPIMFQRSILVRQARFDAGVVLAVLGLDPATRRMVQPYADRLAVGVACGKVAVTQPLSALLALLTMTHRRVRGAKLRE